MAKYRPFNIDLIFSDEFNALSITAQNLYFRLNLLADDMGVCQRLSTFIDGKRLKDTDLDELENNKFIIFYKRLRIVRHWHVHNKKLTNKSSLHDAVFELVWNDKKIMSIIRQKRIEKSNFTNPAQIEKLHLSINQLVISITMIPPQKQKHQI